MRIKLQNLLIFCLLFGSGSLPATNLLAAESATFNKDIAPILFKNCASCHRPGEVGPFSLLKYEDAKKRAEFIREVTHDRRMPPWKADPDYGHFADVRRLSDDDLKTIDLWVKAGAPEGNPADLPAQPSFAEGWQLGEPDLILKMPEPFSIPAQSEDIYRCFVIPIGNETDRTVAAVEFRPGNRSVVHHAILYLDDSGVARRRDASDPGQGYRSFGGPGFVPTGGLGGWAPGSSADRLPDGVAKALRAKSDLVLQIHYHPNGKPETDQSQVGIYFTKKPVQHMVTGIALLNPRVDIPPGDRNWEITDGVTLPVDVLALGISPHMHLLGKDMQVTAELPDGSVVPMVRVRDWDFNWQGSYRYAEPVRLPKGTRIRLIAHYDNSADNPTNPHSPPQRVRWGEQTTDEMCLCTIQVYPERPENLRQLFKLPHGRLGAALAGGTLPESGWQTLLRRVRQHLSPESDDLD